ncbi:MAG: hypothetical protein JO112_19365 [Planctomycetes bacterium]|nr:hypothetical protein [Planctomycetota bacterium]
MALVLSCKFPGCKQNVIYKRETVPALTGSSSGEEIEVYLTCPAGHQLCYTIKPEEEDSGDTPEDDHDGVGLAETIKPGEEDSGGAPPATS